MIGHFTTMISDDVYAVGCAAVQFDTVINNVDFTSTYYVCDYSRASVYGWPVYKAGPTASECKTGTNPKFPALCSVNENYRGPFYYP